MIKPLVIYHGNCQDGFTAAWACWKKHPDWEYYPAKHGDPPPDVTGREIVWMLDFSYKRPVILELAAKVGSIIILDHHKTAEADLVDLPSSVSVTFDMTKSGARLAWEAFHPESTTKKRPMLIDYVEDRDLWRFRFPDTKAVSAYVFAQSYDFHTWDALAAASNDTNDRCREMVARGQAILQKQAKDTDELLQNKFRLSIAGYSVPAANLPYTFSSDAGHILCQGEPFGATFYLDGTSAHFSLRSAEDGTDVSEIAKKFGGGGHKHAAGFKVPLAVFADGL